MRPWRRLIKREGWSFCLSWDSLDRGAACPSVCHRGLSHTRARAAATERQCKQLVAPDVANAQYGLLRSRAFPIHAALDDVFVAIHGRDVRWISIEIGSS